MSNALTYTNAHIHTYIRTSTHIAIHTPTHIATVIQIYKHTHTPTNTPTLTATLAHPQTHPQTRPHTPTQVTLSRWETRSRWTRARSAGKAEEIWICRGTAWRRWCCPIPGSSAPTPTTATRIASDGRDRRSSKSSLNLYRGAEVAGTQSKQNI